MSTPTRAARTSALVVVLAATGFAAGLVAPAAPAAACSCVPPPPPAEAMAASDAVFRGTVVALARSDVGVSVTLKVRTVWKGPTVPRLSLSTGRDSAGCGYPFGFGADMIVYAHAEAAGDFSHLSTSSCDRTATYDAVEAAALGAPLAELPWVDPPAPNCPRCPIPSAAGALAGADVAFHGLPLRIEDVGSPGDASRRVRFRVLGVWKGDVPAEVDVVAPYLAWACRGEHWLDDDAGALVFAQRTADGGLSISICGRLDRYDPADAASLGPMTPAPTAAASPAPSPSATATPTAGCPVWCTHPARLEMRPPTIVVAVGAGTTFTIAYINMGFQGQTPLTLRVDRPGLVELDVPADGPCIPDQHPGGCQTIKVRGLVPGRVTVTATVYVEVAVCALPPMCALTFTTIAADQPLIIDVVPPGSTTPTAAASPTGDATATTSPTPAPTPRIFMPLAARSAP